MAKAAAIFRGFNAGEWSPYMEGRTDNERFGLSARNLQNFIATPQGPVVRRSGTKFFAPIFDESAPARLVPFAFNEEQSLILEFTGARIRFLNDDGLLVAGSAAVTAANGNAITAPGLNAQVGQQIILDGLPGATNQNDQQFTILTAAEPNYTISAALLGFQPGVEAILVYSVAHDLLPADVANLRFLASLDTTFFFSSIAPRRLVRSGPTSWTWSVPAFTNFPFNATTGFPTVGAFYADRLWLGGAPNAPDMIAGSVTGSYYDFSTTNSDGTVTDDRAIVVKFNARKLGQVAWMQSDARGLVFGTGAGVWTLGPADPSAAISPTNVQAVNPTARSSAALDAVKVDTEVCFVQRARRALYALAYTYAEEGYHTQPLSMFATHIGPEHRFAQIDYAEEPHTLVWVRCDDGTLAAITYDKQQQVGAWHRHILDNGVVENIAVIPSQTDVQDALWLQVRRTINGVTRRYVEKLMPAWDFDYTLNDAFYVDAGIEYAGAPITTVYGLTHLEGETVYGLADNAPIPPAVVRNGTIVLQAAASKLVVGKGIDARGETQRPEAGAADGTAQGKFKRLNRMVARFFSSSGGQIGRAAEGDQPELVEPLLLRDTDLGLGQPVPLFTGDYEAPVPEGYNRAGTLLFRQPPELPLPFNLVAIMPDLETQDR